MADIFISYTSSDREWAFWIAKELEALSHTVHIHEWEIARGADIYGWMEAAITIGEKAIGAEHPLTQRYQSHYARLLLMTDRAAEALQLGQAALRAKYGIEAE
jgi:hypothetical protein